MEQTSIDIVRSPEDLADLDELLWNVLWRPLGLSRNIRQELKVDGEAISTFFRKVGFRRAPGAPPDHPVFRKHGITFELIEMVLEPAPEASEPSTST